VLEEHVVVAQKHEMLDEVPVVFAIKSPWTQLTEEQIREKIMQGCAQKLADFKRPRAVYFETELPRVTLEKVAKNKLREMADQYKDEGRTG
jgi:crotonobetaine/carnitine-CoA ligase